MDMPMLPEDDPDHQVPQNPDAMTEEQLVSVLKQEEAAADSYWESELAKNQEEALDRYFARPYGNETEDRSKVVTHDLEDTINWMMPDLMRCFGSAEDLVSVEAQAPEDDQPIPVMINGQIQVTQGPDGQSRPKMTSKSKVDVMGAYLSHIYFKDNRASENTHDFAFDGLLQRIGIMKCAWEDPEPRPSEIVEGLSQQGVMQYANDPEYEIIGQAEEQGPYGPVFMLEVRRTPKMGRVHIEAVPPEEFYLHKLAKNIPTAPYHARKRAAFLAELIRKYPDKAAELRDRRNRYQDIDFTLDGRRQARYPGDNVSEVANFNDEGRQRVLLNEEYIRIDYDGDGIVELRQIKRVDTVVLENIAVCQSDYVSWTPSRVSHKAVGRSIHDMLVDIQKIRTEITRSYLDGLSSTLSPRTYVNTQLVEQDGLDALIENKQSAIIPIKGNAADAVQESVVPDISAPSLQALEYFDQRGQESSGVTKHSQGMDPQALNKTATGIDLLQAAAKTRIEMVAVWLGIGLEDVFKRILQLVVAHQDKPRQVKLFGEWIEIDPRRWSDEMSITINTGSAGVSKQQKLANLGLIAQKQEQILMQAGPSNPLVTLQHYRNTLAAMASSMGFKDPGLFFGDVPEDMPPPEPQPNPDVIKAQAEVQLKAQQQQHQQQLDQAELQHKREMGALEQQLSEAKAQHEAVLAEQRQQAEAQLALRAQDAEFALAQRKQDFDMQLAEQKADHDRKMAEKTAAAKLNGSTPKVSSTGGVHPGGAVG
jgi:hypothetical protein